MIKLTRLNGSVYVLNSSLIETVEAMPDTIITTVDGRKYVCKESVDEVIEKIIQFEGSIRLYADIQKIEGA
ncbi:MAG: flagellar FlbD family protein [Clostridiaceae bacterium]|jgi:flagellar protein FlbD|nr:flagellar FlbD family protein [Clostridiaceae bacterium]HOA55560.1 flagellar FlbD family protein [Clostridiales bacterium]HQD31289.1 flagellar FlbD family protein [Clostridiales bacterium]